MTPRARHFKITRERRLFKIGQKLADDIYKVCADFNFAISLKRLIDNEHLQPYYSKKES